MAAAKEGIYIAVDSAVGNVKGVDYVIIKGNRYKGSHPMVKHAPVLFEQGSAYDDEVEQATAAPGEKR